MTSVTKTWAFGLIVLTTLFTTLAQFFLKSSSDVDALISPPLFLGLFFYAVASCFMILAFKGGEVSALYPVLATSYIWVAIVSYTWFGETIHAFRWAGIIVIIAGITLVGVAGRS